MKKEILLELANKWMQDGEVPKEEDGSEQAKIPNAIAQGQREYKRECADALRTIVTLLG